MMAGYFAEGRARDRATFEMFVRGLPEHRSYLVFAGLEQAIGDLCRLRFSADQVAAIRALPAFSRTDPSFFDDLLTLRFEGDIWSVPEGSVVFANEPILRVEAALPQAQWVETFLLASLGYPTLVASKAARVVEAAEGRPVIDFGLRRGHGPYAGLLAARASYLAGCEATSNVLAALRIGIPCVGTMAHSWVQAFDTEAEAFAAYSRVFPESSTLLVDTYDTEAGVRRAATIEPPIQAVRIDSGDLLDLSRRARAILDAYGRHDVKVFASGDLDEFSISKLLAAEAPIDAFGVGTELVTSRDAPALSLVYKLVELNGKGRIKLSPGKKTYPSAKQIHRRRDEAGRITSDHVTRADEIADGEPLLVPVVQGGVLVEPRPCLATARLHCRREHADLPHWLRGVDAKPLYPLSYSDALEDEAERMGVK
jgi:nicotinate phosphoribosyltransferase